MTFPPGVVMVVWHPAERPWDGTEEVDSAAPFVDRNGLVDGPIFILGTRWKGTLTDFSSVFQANVHSYHGCAAPVETRSLKLDRADAIAWRQHCSDITVLRILSVHNGWGFALSERVLLPEAEATGLDRFVSWIRDGLRWRAT